MGRAENKVADRLVERTEAVGGYAEKVHNEGHIGCPDYIITLPAALGIGSRIRRVETKSKGGRCSPMQDYYHAQLAKRGVIVFVPRTLSDVDLWFERDCPEVKHV